MSGQLKIFLVVLLGIAISLSACSNTGGNGRYSNQVAPSELGKRPEPTPLGTTSASPSAARQPSQTLSQGSSVKSTAASTQAHRQNYKPISLTEIADATALIGNDPKAIAIAAFGNTESEGGSREVTVDYPQPNQAIVTITQTGVADTSISGIRYRIELLPTQSTQTGKQWKIVWAGSQVKCHPGRGHQDWSTELCL